MNEINDLGEAVARALGERLAAAVPEDHRGILSGKLILRLAQEVQTKGKLGPTASETAASLHCDLYVPEGRSKQKTPAQWLSEPWAKAEALYSNVRVVLIEQCRAAGLEYFPAIVKADGEERRKLYYVTAQELPAKAMAEGVQAIDGGDPVDPGAEALPEAAISYKKDMAPQLSRLGKWVFGAGRLLTVRRRVALVMPPILVFIGAFWLNWKIIGAFLVTNRAIYPSDVVLAVVVGAPYVVFKWMSGLMDLVSLRYQAAPDWATGLKEVCAVLELEDIDREAGSARVKVSRYTALCGVCGHTVYLKDGNKQFGRRVVGCCSESPDEHVFTFDPKTKLGYPLRQRRDGYVGL